MAGWFVHRLMNRSKFCCVFLLKLWGWVGFFFRERERELFFNLPTKSWQGDVSKSLEIGSFGRSATILLECTGSNRAVAMGRDPRSIFTILFKNGCNKTDVKLCNWLVLKSFLKFDELVNSRKQHFLRHPH